MEMILALASVRPDVCHDPVAAGETLSLGNALKRCEYRGQQRRVRRAQLVSGAHMSAWDRQYVRRGLGPYVANDHYIVAALNHISGHQAARDAAKEAVGPAHVRQDTRLVALGRPRTTRPQRGRAMRRGCRVRRARLSSSCG
jgi:hypothetical protein